MNRKFNIIITNTNRSVVYLNLFKKNKILPDHIIYLDDNKKNKTSSKIKKILKNKIYLKKQFQTDDINNKEVINYLVSFKSQLIVYSGYPGAIIKDKKLLKKKIIHSHTGHLPHYKGSTTIFYSLLKESRIYCSTILLNKNIDTGISLLIKRYPLPKIILDIDNKYDDEIRAMNIVSLFKSNKDILINKKYKINRKHNLPYYIMHPILRYITMYNRNLN